MTNSSTRSTCTKAVKGSDKDSIGKLIGWRRCGKVAISYLGGDGHASYFCSEHTKEWYTKLPAPRQSPRPTHTNHVQKG